MLTKLKLLDSALSVSKEKILKKYQLGSFINRKFDIFIGRDDTGARMEIMELPTTTHPYFVATQYHPEYISRPLKPSPPYLGLVLSAAGKLQTYLNNALSSNTTSEDGENSGLFLFFIPVF